jgi:hypothetical protein
MSFNPSRSTSKGTEDHFTKIKKRIKCAIGKGPQSLESIIRACEGAYPTVVDKCLEELGSTVTLVSTQTYKLSEASNTQSNEISSLSTIEGNPVLCSWYFTSETCKRIAELHDWSNSKIAFLGTPRLFEWFCRHDLGKERLLLDLDSVVLKTLSRWIEPHSNILFEYDVANDIPRMFKGSYDYVFFDSPWYYNDYLVWFSRASSLSPNGFIVFVLFPQLTRPTAQDERVQITDRLSQAAKSLMHLGAFVDYDIPTFERAQLEAAGLTSLSSWKVADLVIAEQTQEIRWKEQPASLPSDVWEEVDIGSLRVFVNLSKLPYDDPRLLFPIDESRPILSSPSRRNRGRAKANVLTSRGHGLITSRPQQLLHLLYEVKNASDRGQSPNEFIRTQDLDISTRKLFEEILRRQ